MCSSAHQKRSGKYPTAALVFPDSARELISCRRWLQKELILMYLKLIKNTEYLEALVCTSFKKLNLRSWSAESATARFSNPLAEQFLLSQGQLCRMRAPIPHLSMPKWIWQPISKPQSLKEHKEEECALSAPHKTTGKKQALVKCFGYFCK